MTTDSGEHLRHRRQDIWRLPEILAMDVRHRRYRDLRRVTVGGVDRYLGEATEVIVQLSEPLPTRALGPVLWIGDVPLTIAETDDGLEYRFLVMDPEILSPGDSVALAWNTPRALRNPSKFRYQWPDRDRPTEHRGRGDPAGASGGS
jgi:hypothetical protein